MSGSIDKTTFTYDTRFEDLRKKGVSFEDFSAHQDYYMSKLSRTSIMSLANEGLYEKGKALYNTYTDLYNVANNIFHQRKNKKETSKADYNDLIKNFEALNKKQLAKKGQSGSYAVTDAQKHTAIAQSGYTTELINATNDAENLADTYLDKRFMAVDMQRRGLNC